MALKLIPVVPHIPICKHSIMSYPDSQRMFYLVSMTYHNMSELLNPRIFAGETYMGK